MIRIGLVGAGRIAHVHAASISGDARARLSLVFDPVDAAAKQLANKHGAHCARSAEEVLDSALLDAVVVASPATTHAEYTLAAARNGKAVLCEKPVATSVAHGEQTAQALSEISHRPIMVGFQRRFDPAMRQAQEKLQAGVIGALQQLTIFTRDPAPPPPEYIATSGGLFKDASIHDFDIARFYLGEISSVTAHGLNFNQEIEAEGDYDAAIIVLKANSGAVATITNNRQSAMGFDQRVEIHGSAGTLNVENIRGNPLTVSTDEHVGAQAPLVHYFIERYREAYRNVVSSFIDAVLAGGDATPNFHDGVAALRLAEAAEKSARTGQTVNLDSF